MHFLGGIYQLNCKLLPAFRRCNQVKDESRAQSPTLSCPGSPLILYPVSVKLLGQDQLQILKIKILVAIRVAIHISELIFS